jgi:hypothetical protein
MLFDQIDKRNIMMQSILAFEKVGKVSLASFGSRLSRFRLGQPLEKFFSSLELQMR